MIGYLFQPNVILHPMSSIRYLIRRFIYRKEILVDVSPGLNGSFSSRMLVEKKISMIADVSVL